jgi:hypothetical protein
MLSVRANDLVHLQNVETQNVERQKIERPYIPYTVYIEWQNVECQNVDNNKTSTTRKRRQLENVDN